MTAAGRFLTAEWRYLAMLNYEVDPEILRPYVPAGTELDSWGGKTFMSVVGFLFLRTRVLGLPIPFHENFEEVNLRFYVRRRGNEGWQRGVVFIKEIVPKAAIATVARVFYNENYVALPMRHTLHLPDESASGEVAVEYGWRFKDRWSHLRVKTRGNLQPMVTDSLEQFIAEHYWGYTAQRGGGCLEYQVEHPPWRIWQTEECALDCDIAGLYGPQFADTLCSRPASAFLAEGSPVVVRRGTKM
jgi:uncharacterized protein